MKDCWKFTKVCMKKQLLENLFGAEEEKPQKTTDFARFRVAGIKLLTKFQNNSEL